MSELSSATLRTVAKLAKVSPATASRAFKRPEMVSAKTRELIFAAAEALGYSPTGATNRPLSSTGNVGLIVPDIENPLLTKLFTSLQAEAQRHQYHLLIGNADGRPNLERELVGAMQGHVDGLVIASPRLHHHDLQEIADRVPLVLLGRGFEGMARVQTPAEEGLRQAVEHLRALGHRCIAYVGGPESEAAREREMAVKGAAEAQGIECLTFSPFETRIDAGARAADLVIATPATAVIAFNDQIAFGLIQRLEFRGHRVPSNISVVGVDDSWISAVAHPPLTSVRVAIGAAAIQAMDLLLKVIEGGPVDEERVIDSVLIVRDSTAPLAAISRAS